jgi:hypothetical protein
MLLPSVQALLLWCLLVPGFFEWYGLTFAIELTPYVACVPLRAVGLGGSATEGLNATT